jgi:hypothetical protein
LWILPFYVSNYGLVLVEWHHGGLELGSKRHREESEQDINRAPEPKLKAHATSNSQEEQERDTPYTQPFSLDSDDSDHDGLKFESYAGSFSRAGKRAELEAVVKAPIPIIPDGQPVAAILDVQPEAAIPNRQPSHVVTLIEIFSSNLLA